jgi:hypothetical protein
MDTAAPVNTGIELFVVVGVTVMFPTEDDARVDVAAVALPLEAALEVEDPVTVVEVTPPEEAEADEEVVETTTLVDIVGVPSPPVTDGKGGAELPTAEQMASPAVLLDSTHRAPNCGSFRLSSQLPAPREVPEQRRIMGPAAQ